MPSRNVPRKTLSEAYADGGLRPPNILNEWTALDLERNSVTYQLDEDYALLSQPRLGAPLDGATLYSAFTKDDLPAWNRQCIADGRPVPNKQQGWKKLRFDLGYAKEHDAIVRFIHIRYEPNRATEKIQQATFRHDWTGKVIYLHPNSGCYEIAIFQH